MGASPPGVDAALLPPAVVGSTVKFGGCSGGMDLPHSAVLPCWLQQCPGVTEVAVPISVQGSRLNRGIQVKILPFSRHLSHPLQPSFAVGQSWAGRSGHGLIGVACAVSS